jgi:hypothetical protein
MAIDIEGLLSLAENSQISRWELDNVVWIERSSNAEVLVKFLKRISELASVEAPTSQQQQEFSILQDLASEMDQASCEELLSNNDESARQRFIESLARQGALETLCNNAVSIDTMEKMCKLSPNDFILTAKRSQDLINSIQELVIQGETLSSEVAGA